MITKMGFRDPQEYVKSVCLLIREERGNTYDRVIKERWKLKQYIYIYIRLFGWINSDLWAVFYD